MEDRLLVKSDEWLYRRCYLSKLKFIDPDGNVSSRFFAVRSTDNGELSVDVKSMTTIEKAIVDTEKFFLIELLNEDVLKIPEPQLTTYHDPLPEGKNDAHALIVGMSFGDEIAPGELAKISRKVIL